MPPRIVLVGTKDSANVGAAARAMKNFGLRELVLLAPRCELDRRAYALASHAADVLDQARVALTGAEALEGCTYAVGTTARPRASSGFTPAAPRAALARMPLDGGALLFGREDTGLSNAELDLCQAVLTIPTTEYASLNLGQAVNVVAYEWFQLVHAAPAEEPAAPGLPTAPEGGDAGPPPAPREALEAMYEQMMEALLLIGYTDPPRARSIEHLFRRLLDRARPSAREVAALRGLWSQAMWAAEQPPERLPGRRGRR